MEIETHIKKGVINAFQLKQKIVDKNDFSSLEENVKVKNYILKRTSCFDKRLIDSLKLVNLDEDILNKKMNILSSSEKMKVILAIDLILNSSTLYIYRFDAYFMEKDLLFFKKLFKKLVNKYHKTIVFINCKPSFLLDFVDHYVIERNKNEFVEIEKPTFYEKKLENLIEIPKIVEFVNYINEDGKRINQYGDLKELLKAIFREV